ncbi:hypothetical protein I6E74_06150 [Salinibacterium sp. SWN139]|uniref:hypothetical protein n=1 Tax=Salinibacterium sp. SWN139 TaxID=2792055 RepID=UPI0018CFC27C|nr:hypothetical protein [Salinibacterium sp. SWN139]MBH0053753.1 hypothetical protein [Salinibacterium sp. SWN139]
MTLRLMPGSFFAAIAAVALLAGCTATDVDSSDSSSADAATPAPASTASSEGGAGESSDSTLTTRRMTVDDVTIADLTASPLPDGYAQSAVSVDAWPAVDVLVDATDAEVVQARGELAATLGGADIVITAEVASCELIAVWVLPQPDSLRVGHETNPSAVGCSAPTTYDVLFAIPKAGTNSEGSWDYTSTVAPIQLERRVGTQS